MELRKLTALRKSLGEEIADKAFSEWYEQRDAAGSAGKADPNISKTFVLLGLRCNLSTVSVKSRGSGVGIKKRSIREATPLAGRNHDGR